LPPSGKRFGQLRAGLCSFSLEVALRTVRRRVSMSATVGVVSDARLSLGATEVHDMWSAQVEDTFRIFVAACGHRPQGKILVTDGNGLFGLVVDTIRLMQIPALLPPIFVVGVGYPGADTAADTIEIRTRDLTPTLWPAYPGSGGADRFLSFLGGSLFEWIAH